MSFMDKVKQGMDKAKAEISDLAATTKIRHDISNLNDRKSAPFAEIGRHVYGLSQQGMPRARWKPSAVRLPRSMSK